MTPPKHHWGEDRWMEECPRLVPPDFNSVLNLRSDELRGFLMVID
jgi:hypothetical protein